MNSMKDVGKSCPWVKWTENESIERAGIVCNYSAVPY